MSRRATYEAIARALGPERILIIRTLDVGGDKPIAVSRPPAEANPFLGERGMRLTLDPSGDVPRPGARDPSRVAGRESASDVPDDRHAERMACGARELVERERVALALRRYPSASWSRRRQRR